MRVPVMLYDVCRGAGPDDPGAVLLVTARAEAVAAEFVRQLERRRATGELVIAGACFVRAVESAVTAESAEAAARDGYCVRYSLAPLPDEPLDREVGSGAEADPLTEAPPADDSAPATALEDEDGAGAAEPQEQP